MGRLGIFAILAILAGCSTPVPDSGAGVGFGNYTEYQRSQTARDVELEGTTGDFQDGILPPTGPTPPGPDDIEADGVVVTDVIGAEDGAAANAAPVVAGQAVVGSTGISDEQNFDSVSGQRSIESDAARIAANRQQYRVVQPGALPTRPGDAGPNVVAYALATNNPVGTPIYPRRGFNLAEKSLRNCAAYASPDLAQQAFLANGGPDRDRQALDPDGDGFACSWDPTPFRAVAGN